MLKALLLSLCTVISTALFALPEADSLLHRIANTRGIERFEAQLALANLGAYTNHDLKHQMLAEADQWSRQYGDTAQRLQLLYHMAKVASASGHVAKGVLLALQVAQSERTSKSLQFLVSHFLRDEYVKLGSLEKAVAFHNKIDWSQADDHWEQNAPSNFLAYMHLKLGNYQMSARYFRQCVHSMKQSDMPYWEMSMTNSLGFVYELAGMADSAWFYYEKALEVLHSRFVVDSNMNQLTYNFSEGLIYGNMAQLLAAEGEHLQAIPLYKRDVEASLADSLNSGQRQNGITSLIKLSASYRATKQFELSHRALVRASRLLKNYDYIDQLATYWRAMWSQYEAENKTDSALWAAGRYVMVRDSIDGLQNAKRTQDLLLAHDVSQREGMFEQNRRKLEELQHEAYVRNYVFVALVSGLVLFAMLVIVLVMAGRQRRITQRSLANKNDELAHSQHLLALSLQEKDALLREVHHRVKNNLQIISSLFFLQSKRIHDPEALAVMAEGQHRVQIMSLIHQKLYQSEKAEMVQFKKFITELAGQIVESHRPSQVPVSLQIEVADFALTVEHTVPLSLIVNELITNSLKHAFDNVESGTIQIVFEVEEGFCLFTYCDSGRGFVPPSSAAESDHLGLKLVHLFGAQLGGKVQFASGAGMSVEIRFPLQAGRA